MTNVSKLIFLVFLILSVFGILMIYSASYNLSLVYKQIVSLLIGLILFFLIQKIDINRLKDYLVLLVLFNIFLLVVVLTPLGVEINGSKAWIRLGFFNFQPSELAKITMVLYASYFISKNMDRVKDFKMGFVPPFILMLVFAFLLNLEPDLGNAAIIGLIFIVLMFVGNTPFVYFFPIGFFSLLGFIVLLFSESYRIKRILAFIDPWKDPLGYGYNIIQSLIAHGRGYIWGVGLGNSVQKNYYLPEKHTDFIFSVIGEELGLVGNLIILIIFLSFFTLIFYKTLKIDDMFHKLLLFGLSFMIFINAVINMSVTLSLMPATGITLPFVSYGGTSLIVNWIALGLIVNILNVTSVKKHKANIMEKIVINR